MIGGDEIVWEQGGESSSSSCRSKNSIIKQSRNGKMRDSIEVTRMVSGY